MITKEQIKLIDNVDCWAQENNKFVDKKFSAIYRCAENTDNGWWSVCESSPVLGAQALALALEWRESAGV